MTTCGMSCTSLARWPPRFAYQVWLWTRSASPVPAAIVRSIDIARSAASSGAGAGQRVPRLVADGAGAVGAPGVDVDLDQVAQLARQVLDVHAGPAVDVRRVLAREERGPHAATVAPLGMTTTPPAEIVKRSRSASGSTPICGAVGDAHVLVDDGPAHDGVAPDVDALHEHRVLDLGVGVQVHARGEHRAAHRAAGDDDAGADHRVERHARAGRPRRRRRTWPAAADRAT